MSENLNTPLVSPAHETFPIEGERRRGLQDSAGATALYGTETTFQELTEGEMVRQRVRQSHKGLKELSGRKGKTETASPSRVAPLPPKSEFEGGRTDRNAGDLTSEMQDAKDILDAQRWELTDLAEQLKQPIEDGVYDSLIGDDVSGRLPTMFVYRLMERHAQESGTKPPNIIFAAPSKHPRAEGIEPWEDGADEKARTAKDENMRRYFAKQASLGRLGKRSLLVTEMIATGENLSELTGNVPDDHQVDVATLITSPYFTEERRKELLGDARFYHTAEGYVPQGRGKITGRTKDHLSATSHRAENYDPRLANFAYAYTQKMADEVYETVFKQPAAEF